ncbi:2-oxo-hept-4-ene-1,7-dioate hydratase [Candidatus Foliamicus sp.]
MLSKSDITECADNLYRAERDRIQIPALTRRFPKMDMEDAYAVQRAWIQRKLADGRKITGYKIGLTSRAMQVAMKINSPDFGVLLDDMVIRNGATISASAFTDPRVETEFAFVLKDRLSGDKVTVEQVLAATDYVVPALELIAARSFRVDPDTGYTRNVMDTIADNAASAGYVLGDSRICPRSIDLTWAGAMLYLNGEIEETGLAGGVMGHPAHGVRWACQRFASHSVAFLPGHVILAGSFTRPIAVKAGDRVRADFGPHGSVAVGFA